MKLKFLLIALLTTCYTVIFTSDNNNDIELLESLIRQQSQNNMSQQAEVSYCDKLARLVQLHRYEMKKEPATASSNYEDLVDQAPNNQ